MKKLFILFIAVLLLVPIIGIFDNEKINADEYGMSCPIFEVSYINDDGSLSKVECYDSFESGKAKMKENKDYVLRHVSSLSPTKIVAMNSGLAYSYPYRSGTNTQKIYETINEGHNGTGVNTYVAEHYEMTYYDTTFFTTFYGYAGGWVNVTLNGFTGYADLEYVDLVPTKYIDTGLKIKLGGNDKTGSGEEPFNVICHQNYYYVERNGNYNDLCFKYYRAWGEDSDAISSTVRYGVAPDFMEIGKKYYSNDGISFYSDPLLKNLVGVYINYYQFLPLRSYTKISAATMNAFISENGGASGVLLNTGQDFIADQNEYGCNAATILSMAIHESGWGKSSIAKNKYNLFGWGAFDSATSNATRYESVAECVKAQMGDNLANYLDPTCSTYFSSSLGNKGGGFITKYASDPYWAEKISSYYYKLDKYDNNNNGNLTDYNSYTLAYVIENTEAKKEANSSSLTYYNTANKTGYQKNVVVIVLGTNGNYTKIQSSNPINDNGMIYPISLEKGTLVSYNRDKSVAYIKSDKLVYINGENAGQGNDDPSDIVVNPSDKKGYAYVEEFNLSNNTITISGIAFIEGLNYNDKTLVGHKLVFKDYEDQNKEYVYDLDNMNSNGFSLGDGYDYKYTGYKGYIDLKDIPNGNYIVYIRVINGNTYKDIQIKSSDSKYANLVSTYLGYTNRITTNERYNYRFELEIMSTPLNYASILKPSIRKSLFVYNDLIITDDGYLYINGTSMIYYLDYDNPNNIEYNAYLVNSSKDYLKLDTRIYDSPINYNDIIDSNYDLSNITFEAYGDISGLKGKYAMILEIKNKSNGKTYVDYVEMSNSSNYEMPSKAINGKNYKVVKENTRDRMIFAAGE